MGTINVYRLKNSVCLFEEAEGAVEILSVRDTRSLRLTLGVYV